MIASGIFRKAPEGIRSLMVWVLLTLCAAVSYAAPRPQPADPEEVAKALETLLSSNAIDTLRFALKVTDLSTGDVVAEYASDRPLTPASIMKTVSIATLLKEKGPRWTYNTRVVCDGPVKDSVLRGNIIVVGSGDPSVNSKAEPHTPDLVSEVVNALKEKGVTEIEGRIIIDNNLFQGPSVPDTWARGDLPHAYGTGSHAFNFENNASGKTSVADPGARFSSRLSTALASAGITLRSGQVDEGRYRTFVEHRSAPIEEIMRSCMMRSDNLFAESFLRTYSSSVGKDGSTAKGADSEYNYWKKKGADMEDVVITDGSGLSRSNRLTADFLTDILRKMSDNVEYVSFFPLAGQEGTLRRFMAGTRLDSYLAMKTGSMSGIQSYAGYLLDDDFAPTHTVVVIVNGMKADRATLRKDLGDFFLSIF